MIHRMITAAIKRLQYSSTRQRSSGIARVSGDIRHFYAFFGPNGWPPGFRPQATFDAKKAMNRELVSYKSLEGTTQHYLCLGSRSSSFSTQAYPLLLEKTVADPGLPARRS